MWSPWSATASTIRRRSASPTSASHEARRRSSARIGRRPALWKLVKAVEISRGAVRLIHQNYAIVAGLNTLAFGLALPGGLIIPEVTALISNGSAILASLNGIRPILRYQ